MIKSIERNSEYDAAIRRHFDTELADYIRMDGWDMRNQFLAGGWNYAIDQGWLRVVDVELEQETFMKGYLTDKGRKDLGL